MVVALCLNSGSSSVKYGLFQTGSGPELEPLCSGLVDKIGLQGCVIKHEIEATGKSQKIDIALPDHAAALKKVVELLQATDSPVKNLKDIVVIGHRVVHGGDTLVNPTILDSASEAKIEEVTPLAPLHNPANMMGIRVCKDLFPWAKQVAVFDTAFHATMPPESYRYAIPKELYEKHHIRRYGFHGTSYKYVSGATAQAMGRPLAELNMIICHLGNGSSMACLKHGQVVDTTMGLTPLEGMVMGTRSGDIDAGVYTFLCDNLKMSYKDVDTLLNKKSGLLGVTGKSDMREVIDGAKNGDPDCQLARSLFVQRVRKYIGAFLVKLDGHLDALVFTAGVGENDKGFRELVTANLQRFGIEVDPARNQALKGSGEIQSARSTVKVMVTQTQEELCIAEQSLQVCGFAPKAKL